MKKTILKYGVFAILILMSFGLLVILKSFEIRTKTSAILIAEANDTCTAYVTYAPHFNPEIGDTIEISQTLGGNLRFVVENISKEPTNLVLTLHPADKRINLYQSFGGNSLSNGYIFTGKIKLRELVLMQLTIQNR